MCDLTDSMDWGLPGLAYLFVGGVATLVVFVRCVMQLRTLASVLPEDAAARRLYWVALLLCLVSVPIAIFCAETGSWLIGEIGDGRR